ncbi:MAG: 3-methyl-2-oxobutanoate hydroxymethyltransferase [Planctomycetota bacterium]
MTPRKGIPSLQQMKQEGQKIIMLTAYDYPMARLLDPFVDILLVGDSLGCVIQGKSNTLQVTLDQMIYHSEMVVRGTEQSIIVGDMPFGTFHQSIDKTSEAAVRLMKEAGVHAVKIEGGQRSVKYIEALTQVHIPVMGHIGLTPQSVNKFGGHKVQGRTEEEGQQILEDALAVEEAGVFSVVLEGIPIDLAAKITEALKIPTIGIGAGPHCDGQVLVSYDMLGFNEFAAPMKFTKEYGVLRDVIRKGVQQYVEEVKTNLFPTALHGYKSSKKKENPTNDPSRLIAT